MVDAVAGMRELTVRAVVVAGQDVGLLGAEAVPVGGCAGVELGLGAAEAGVDDPVRCVLVGLRG